MGERRAERARMRRHGELAVVRDAQGFLFDATQAGRQRVPLRAGSQQGQAVRERSVGREGVVFGIDASRALSAAMRRCA